MHKQDHIIKVRQRDGNLKVVGTVSEHDHTPETSCDLCVLAIKITEIQEAIKAGRPMPDFVVDVKATETTAAPEAPETE